MQTYHCMAVRRMVTWDGERTAASATTYGMLSTREHSTSSVPSELRISSASSRLAPTRRCVFQGHLAVFSRSHTLEGRISIFASEPTKYTCMQCLGLMPCVRVA